MAKELTKNQEKLLKLVKLAEVEGSDKDLLILEEIEAIEEKFLNKMSKMVEEFNQSIALLKKGEEGIKINLPSENELIEIIKSLIPKIEDGHTPTNEELLNLITPLIPKVKDGEPGKNGTSINREEVVKYIMDRIKVPTTEEVVNNIPIVGEKVRDSLELLVGDERLDSSAIKNLPELEKKVAKAGWGAHPLQIKLNGVIKDKIARILNFKGTAITSIVRLPDGTVEITIDGGSSGLSKETPTGTVNDVNVTFTVTHEPFFINVNGAIYNVGDGAYASYVAGTITLNYPVGTGGFIKSYYQ